MPIIEAPDKSRRRAAAIGMFDGVHTGHVHLLDQVRNEAVRRGLTPAAVTFGEHPSQVLTPHSPVALLTSPPERFGMLQESGINDVIVLGFTPELRRLTSAKFLEMLHDSYGVDCLVVGFNNRFGSDREHDFSDYVRFGKKIGVDVVRATEKPGRRTSSSVIRRALAAGDVEMAAECLGRYYELRGVVVHGRRVGHGLGYPTANISPSSPRRLVPAPGVYAARAVDLTAGGRRFMAMVNIGTRPTLDNGSDVTIEAHLLDFEGNIYGHELELAFVARLRDEMCFASLDGLRMQLANDAEATRSVLQQNDSIM